MSAVSLDHIADFARRYPGETVTFFTRVQVREATPGYNLTVHLPAGLVPGDYRAVNDDGVSAEFATSNGEAYLTWRHAQPVNAGDVFEYQLLAVATPVDSDQALACAAWATIGDEPAGDARETAIVNIRAKARSLAFLPAIYADDELMGRFLMLFDSFWQPLENQLGGIWNYFDPNLMPSDWLPWVASWIHLALDERWPEAKRRQLLRAAVTLYRQRGTKAGLLTYLEIYTDTRAHIVEHGGNNFKLGPSARLGAEVSLGRLNQPHTFTVTMRLPPVDAPPAEIERLELERQRTIENIINAEKPAHTAYTLKIEPIA